jgi:hypothetical protein
MAALDVLLLVADLCSGGLQSYPTSSPRRLLPTFDPPHGGPLWPDVPDSSLGTTLGVCGYERLARRHEAVRRQVFGAVHWLILPLCLLC